MLSTYISYVLSVEFIPARQNSILSVGGLPVVVWVHYCCFAGLNTPTESKLMSPLEFKKVLPPIAMNRPFGPQDET